MTTGEKNAIRWLIFFMDETTQNQSETLKVNPAPNHPKEASKPQLHIIKPKLGGFLAAYIIFGLPGLVASLVWLLVGVVALVGISASIASAELQPTDTLTFTEIKSGDRKKTILVYNLNGPISIGTSSLPSSSRETGIYTELVKKDFDLIKKESNIENVVFRLNTPGGEATASKILGDLINDLVKSKGQDEALFYFDRIAASGGLLAAYKSPKNYIIGSPYGMTGSIGVYLTLPNFTGTAEKIGYSQTVIKSTSGKDLGDPLEPTTKQTIEYYQKQIDRQFSDFKNITASGRKMTVEEVAKVADGMVYFNDEAKKMNLLDELGSLDLATSRAAKNSNLGDNYRVEEIKSEFGIFESLLANNATQNFFGISKSTQKVIDRATFFKPGTAYYIDETRI